MHQKLSHLSTQEIQTLMQRYYAMNSGETAKVLIEEYGIDTAPSNLIRLFPNICCEEKCEYCGVPLEIKPIAKSNLRSHIFDEPKACPNCKHTLSSKVCYCENCVEKRKRDHIEKEGIARNQIRGVYGNPCPSVKYEELNFLQKVFLGTLLRGYLSEDLMTIEGMDPDKLTPDGRQSKSLLKHLYEANIITVSPESPVSAFIEEDFPHTYYIWRVKYNLNIEIVGDKKEYIQSILYPTALSEADKHLAYGLWVKIAVEECLSYLRYQLERVNFDFVLGDRTYIIFEELLQHFSTAQIYSLIWKKVCEATRAYQSNEMSKEDAMQRVVNGCLRYGESAISKGWELPYYNRPKTVPQTLISEYFFNQLLKIQELGFEMTPTPL
ncbi:hypothetical protein QTL86_01995 [Cellulosilyticum sp. ST5]|uniref:hypothetical protein n=1 Tax=Cellulosilyticum sp. ST5 TaxID=3055805 RepID=UPI0039778736